jgi:FG-GAP-like repeat
MQLHLTLLLALGLGAAHAPTAQSPRIPSPLAPHPIYVLEEVVHTGSSNPARGACHGGDVDGDGDVDLVYGAFGFPKVALVVLLNDGHERYSERLVPSTKIALGGVHYAREIRLADFDSDGDLDVALVSLFAPGLEIWENDGKGNFTLGNGKKFKVPHLTRPPSNAAAAYALEVGDVDGDGDQDILVGRHLERNLLLLNNGSGVFTGAKALAAFTTKGWVYEVAMGDVNNDGVLDLLFCFSGAAQELWISTAKGVYFRGSVFPAYAAKFSSIVDLDGDGNAEVVLQDFGPNKTHVYKGDGKGGFTLSRTFPKPRYNHFVVDYDNDGDLDLFFRGFDRPRLYRNDGKLVFTEVTAKEVPWIPTGWIPVPVDIDGDGDTDLCNWQFLYPPGKPRIPQLHFVRNRVRHLQAPGRGAVGQSLRVDMFADDKHRMLLAVSTRERRTPTPWGMFFLDPLTTLVLPPKTLFNRQPEGWTFPVPAQQALVGWKLSFQALDIPPGAGQSVRFSNLKQVELVK